MGGVEASEAAGTTADPARPRLKVAVVLWELESNLREEAAPDRTARGRKRPLPWPCVRPVVCTLRWARGAEVTAEGRGLRSVAARVLRFVWQVMSTC